MMIIMAIAMIDGDDHRGDVLFLNFLGVEGWMLINATR